MVVVVVSVFCEDSSMCVLLGKDFLLLLFLRASNTHPANAATVRTISTTPIITPLVTLRAMMPSVRMGTVSVEASLAASVVVSCSIDIAFSCVVDIVVAAAVVVAADSGTVVVTRSVYNKTMQCEILIVMQCFIIGVWWAPTFV